MTRIKRSKYGNRKVTDAYGNKFDSKKEKDRYYELLMMEKGGIIQNLQRQVHFELLPAVYEDVTIKMKTKVKEQRQLLFRATEYVADFTYIQDGEDVVEDVKASANFQDPVYKLKKKMMYYIHNVKIKEVY